MVRLKPPDRPGVRFSCSPRMELRLLVRSSASETAPAFWLDTLKSTWPAVTRAGRGAQPPGVRLILTWLAFPEPWPPAAWPAGDEASQPAAMTASPAVTAATPAPRAPLAAPAPRGGP